MSVPRPSPTASATLFPKGHLLEGNDGRMYKVLITAAGVHRWTPVSNGSRGGRVVTVVDNGGRPFRVHLTSVSGPGTAEVDVRDKEEDLYKHWQAFEYEKVFIGLDPDEKAARTKMWWHGGNALLLRLPARNKGRTVYVFIGWEIHSFIPHDDITKLVSRMGNSAVPYPVAVGKDNLYLLTENTYIPTQLLADLTDPYTALYVVDLKTGLPSKSDRAQKKNTDMWRTSHRLTGRKVLHKRVWS